MTLDSFFFAYTFTYFLLNQFIAYLMLQFANPDNKSQDMIFRLIVVQALRANTDETPPAEILQQVLNRLSLASELRQTTQVLGPLITTIEVIPEDDFDDLEFLEQDRLIAERIPTAVHKSPDFKRYQ